MRMQLLKRIFTPLIAVLLLTSCSSMSSGVSVGDTSFSGQQIQKVVDEIGSLVIDLNKVVDGGVFGEGYNLICQILDPARARAATELVKDGDAVKIPLVDGVDRAQNQIVSVVKRVFRLDLIGRQQARGGSCGGLHRMACAQNLGKSRAVGQIHIAKVLDL